MDTLDWSCLSCCAFNKHSYTQSVINTNVAGKPKGYPESLLTDLQTDLPTTKMTTLELNEITESGEITFTNGQVSRQSSYSDCLKLFGELISNGDYQLLTFYLAKNPLKLREKEITIGLVFRNEKVSSLKVHLSDNEIIRLTKNLSTDRQKIAKVKEILGELLTTLTNKTGEKARGRRYFQTYSWGFFDLINPTKKWPSIIVNYKTD